METSQSDREKKKGRRDPVGHADRYRGRGQTFGEKNELERQVVTSTVKKKKKKMRKLERVPRSKRNEPRRQITRNGRRTMFGRIPVDRGRIIKPASYAFMEIAAKPLAVLVYFIFYDVYAGPSRGQIGNRKGTTKAERREVETSCGAFCRRRCR